MQPRIEMLPKKWMIGKSIEMSLAENKTSELWKSFMTSKKEIGNALNTDLYSIQIYDRSLDFNLFTPHTKFKKYAAIEVANFNTVPNTMETFILEEGLYAIFIHKGLASEFHKTFRYILRQWLPSSNYTLDQRPHFEVLGSTYKNNDPTSEEQVWIPIKPKE